MLHSHLTGLLAIPWTFCIFSCLHALHMLFLLPFPSVSVFQFLVHPWKFYLISLLFGVFYDSPASIICSFFQIWHLHSILLWDSSYWIINIGLANSFAIRLRTPWKEELRLTVFAWLMLGTVSGSIQNWKRSWRETGSGKLFIQPLFIKHKQYGKEWTDEQTHISLFHGT